MPHPLSNDLRACAIGPQPSTATLSYVFISGRPQGAALSCSSDARAGGGVEDEEAVLAEGNADLLADVAGEILRRLDGQHVLASLDGHERVVADQLHRIDFGPEMALAREASRHNPPA